MAFLAAQSSLEAMDKIPLYPVVSSQNLACQVVTGSLYERSALDSLFIPAVPDAWCCSPCSAPPCGLHICGRWKQVLRAKSTQRAGGRWEVGSCLQASPAAGKREERMLQRRTRAHLGMGRRERGLEQGQEVPSQVDGKSDWHAQPNLEELQPWGQVCTDSVPSPPHSRLASEALQPAQSGPRHRPRSTLETWSLCRQAMSLGPSCCCPCSW